MGGEQMVGGGAETPGAKPAFPSEGGEMGDDLDQDLLGRVFCIGGQKEGSSGQPIDAVLDPSNQLPKGVSPALSGQLDQGFKACFIGKFLLCHEVLFPIRHKGRPMCDTKNRMISFFTHFVLTERLLPKSTT